MWLCPSRQQPHLQDVPDHLLTHSFIAIGES